MVTTARDDTLTITADRSGFAAEIDRPCHRSSARYSDHPSRLIENLEIG
ncbi:MAG: hypothetical protein AAFY46_14200 [Planctomycetota bacterium]